MPRPGPPAPRTESSLIVCPSNECRAWWPPHILNPSVILTPHKLLATPPTQPTHQRNFHPSYLLSDRPVNPSQQSRRAVDWPDQATAVVISRKYLGAVGCNSCRASHHSDQSQPPAPLSPYRHISNRSAMMVSSVQAGTRDNIFPFRLPAYWPGQRYCGPRCAVGSAGGG